MQFTSFISGNERHKQIKNKAFLVTGLNIILLDISLMEVRIKREDKTMPILLIFDFRTYGFNEQSACIKWMKSLKTNMTDQNTTVIIQFFRSCRPWGVLTRTETESLLVTVTKRLLMLLWIFNSKEPFQIIQHSNAHRSAPTHHPLLISLPWMVLQNVLSNSFRKSHLSFSFMFPTEAKDTKNVKKVKPI